MAKIYSPITFSHQADDFWHVYHTSGSAVERRRAEFFALLAEGRSEADVLTVTQYSVRSARKIIERYHTLGLDGLGDGRAHNRGAPTVLSADEQQALAARLRADFEQGIVWDGKKVQAWIKEQFGKDVYLARTYEFIRAAGLSPQQLRPPHVKGDPVAQENSRTQS